MFSRKNLPSFFVTLILNINILYIFKTENYKNDMFYVNYCNCGEMNNEKKYSNHILRATSFE